MRLMALMVQSCQDRRLRWTYANKGSVLRDISNAEQQVFPTGRSLQHVDTETHRSRVSGVMLTLAVYPS